MACLRETCNQFETNVSNNRWLAFIPHNLPVAFSIVRKCCKLVHLVSSFLSGAKRPRATGTTGIV